MAVLKLLKVWTALDAGAAAALSSELEHAKRRRAPNNAMYSYSTQPHNTRDCLALAIELGNPVLLASLIWLLPMGPQTQAWRRSC